jgi:hypothetical protein
MTRYNAALEDFGQGSFFEVQIKGNGSTEPTTYDTQPVLTEHPEGFYPEEAAPSTEPVLSGQEIVDSVAAATHRNRQRAQLGRHSAIGPDGTYTDVQPGKVLPGFGPVTRRNWELALLHAAHLNRQRAQSKAAE